MHWRGFAKRNEFWSGTVLPMVSPDAKARLCHSASVPRRAEACQDIKWAAFLNCLSLAKDPVPASCLF